MPFGDTLIESFAAIEEEEGSGEFTPGRSLVYFKIKSKDFRNRIESLGNKIDDMESALRYVGNEIAKFFIQHFEDDQGPDETENILDWGVSAPYSQRAKKPGLNWIDRKLRSDENQGGNKLLYYKGDLLRSLTPDGPNNIFIVSDKKLEVGSRDPTLKFHQKGYNVVSHGKTYETEKETKRPIIGLTEDERTQIVDDFAEHWFGDKS